MTAANTTTTMHYTVRKSCKINKSISWMPGNHEHVIINLWHWVSRTVQNILCSINTPLQCQIHFFCSPCFSLSCSDFQFFCWSARVVWQWRSHSVLPTLSAAESSLHPCLSVTSLSFSSVHQLLPLMLSTSDICQTIPFYSPHPCISIKCRSCQH